MKQIFCYTTTLALITTIPALAAPLPSPGSIQLPAGFQYPNGITHSRNGTLYVGSVTSGQILQITPNGKTETFFPGTDEIFAATSLRLDEQRGILWGASPDFLSVRGTDGQTTRRPSRIFAIDTRSAKVLQVIPISNSKFRTILRHSREQTFS